METKGDAKGGRMNLIDKLKILYEERHRELHDIERWDNAIEDAWPKLLALYEAVKTTYHGPQLPQDCAICKAWYALETEL